MSSVGRPISTTPAAARIPVARSKQKSKPKTATPPTELRPAYRARRQPDPYVPGQYDRILGTRRQPDPADVRSLLIELSGSGLSVMAEIGLRDAGRDRHLLEQAEFPYYVDIELRDGRSVQVEVRLIDRVPDEDLMVMPTAERSAAQATQAAAVQDISGPGDCLFTFVSDSSGRFV